VELLYVLDPKAIMCVDLCNPKVILQSFAHRAISSLGKSKNEGSYILWPHTIKPRRLPKNGFFPIANCNRCCRRKEIFVKWRARGSKTHPRLGGFIPLIPKPS
jgi:hypothetical protein